MSYTLLFYLQLIEKVVEKPFYDRWDYDNQVQDENGQMRAPKAERMTEAEVVQVSLERV